MKRLYDKNCKYALILEDDAIATWDWFDKTMDSIEELNSLNDQWFCLKLFTSFQTFDWMRNYTTVFKSFLFVILFTIIQCILLKYFLKLKLLNLLPVTSVNSLEALNLTKKSILKIFLHTLFLKIYLNCTSAFSFGSGLNEFSQGYNTVAIVYPNKQLSLLSSNFEQHIDDLIKGKIPLLYPKDLLMNEYIKANHAKEYVIEPSLFQHIGVYSSLGNRGSDLKEFQYGPFESYSFEANLQPIIFKSDFWNSWS